VPSTSASSGPASSSKKRRLQSESAAKPKAVPRAASVTDAVISNPDPKRRQAPPNVRQQLHQPKKTDVSFVTKTLKSDLSAKKSHTKNCGNVPLVGLKKIKVNDGKVTIKEVLLATPSSKPQKKLSKSVPAKKQVNTNINGKKVAFSSESSSEAQTAPDRAVGSGNCEKHPAEAESQHCATQKKAQCRSHPSSKPNAKKGKTVMKKCKSPALVSVPVPVTRTKKLEQRQKLKSVKKICLKKYPVTRRVIVSQMKQQAVAEGKKKVPTRRKQVSGDNNAGSVDTAGHVTSKGSQSPASDNQPSCGTEHSEQSVTPATFPAQVKSAKKGKDEESAVKKGEKKKVVRRKPMMESVGNCGDAVTESKPVEGTSGPTKDKTEVSVRRKEGKVSDKEEITSNVKCTKKKLKPNPSQTVSPSKRNLAKKMAVLKPAQVLPTKLNKTTLPKISSIPKVSKKLKQPKKKKMPKIAVKAVVSTDQISDTVVEARHEEERKLQKDGDDSSTSDEITLDLLLLRQQQMKQEHTVREEPSVWQRSQSHVTTVGPFPAVETDKLSASQNIEIKPSLSLIASVKIEETISDPAVASSSPSTGNTSDDEDLKSMKSRIKVKLEDNSESEREKAATKRTAIAAMLKSDDSSATRGKVEEVTIKKESKEDTVKAEDKTSESDIKVTDDSRGKERAKKYLGVKRSRAEGGKSGSSGSDTERRARRMKLFGFWSGPKRHRVASLNALAKVHCLYENESRGALVGVCGGTNAGNNQRATKPSLSPENGTLTTTRTLRSAPGLRGVGKHWDMHNASSTSSSDDNESNSESYLSSPCSPPASYKPKRCQPKVPTAGCKIKGKSKQVKSVKKVVKRQRSRCELMMDLKDMVVRKRMASLNASAILAASYCVEKRAVKSVKEDAGVTVGTNNIQVKNKTKKRLVTNKVLEVEDESSSISSDIEIEECDLEDRGSSRSVIEVRTTPSGGQSSNKKVAVIVNQDTDVTITGVYVNSTTRSTHHEGFCSIAGMQYRISSTSHTQTEATAVATETVLHTSTAAEHVSRRTSTLHASWYSDGRDPLCSYSRTYQHFIQAERSLPCSPPMMPIVSKYNPVHTIPSYLSNIHLNIIQPPTSLSSQWSISFRLSHQ
jgi:hypothetical protein